MATQIYLSRPTAVIPVANVFVAGLLQRAVQARFEGGAETVALVYDYRGEPQSVEVTPQTDWEITTTDAACLLDDEELATFNNRGFVGQVEPLTGPIDVAVAEEFIRETTPEV
ncbi:hypothetical protein [Kocuria sp. CPCC 205297]|uniref:hypothetical protein n=1 Tax=Kocuria sp. CPCC 205297 TaxID=3073558 RepID=UPI0034D608B9